MAASPSQLHRPQRACVDCGVVGPIHGYDRCSGCAYAYRKAHPPGTHARRTGLCHDCFQRGPIYGAGRCLVCYGRYRRATAPIVPSGPVEVPLPERPGPVRCRVCGLRFTCWALGECHVLPTGRHLGAGELAMRGWAQVDGRWHFPKEIR